MKWTKRSITCVLLAGLTVLTYSCRREKTGITWLSTTKLDRFPSASAIEYAAHRLYVFGDDASFLLLTDSQLHQQDTVQFFPGPYRLSKESKHDIEAATLAQNENVRCLVALGSCSDEHRKNMFVFLLDQPRSFHAVDLNPFLKQLDRLPEINFEGLTSVGSRWVIANRANNNNPQNLLIITEPLWTGKNIVPPAIMKLQLKGKKVTGVSGLYYVAEKDLLLFTASEEDTPSATQDGVIGDSYLGWISAFSKKMDQSTCTPDRLMRLSQVHPTFAGQKIESVCLKEIQGDQLELYLAADNDNGQSTLFRIALTL